MKKKHSNPWLEILDVGSRIQDLGHRTQDIGFRIQDIGSMIWELGSRIQNKGFRMQDVGCRILDQGCRTQDLEFRNQCLCLNIRNDMKKKEIPYSGILDFWGYLIQFFYLINAYSFSCYNPLIVILILLYFMISFLYDFVRQKICTYQTIILIKLIMGVAAFFDMKQNEKLKISMDSYFQLSILWKAIYLGQKISFH